MVRAALLTSVTYTWPWVGFPHQPAVTCAKGQLARALPFAGAGRGAASIAVWYRVGVRK